MAVIAGLAVTSENYSTAVQTLQEKFGQVEVIVTTLYAKLHHMKSSSSSYADIQNKHQALETILQQLENQGEKLDEQRSLYQQLLAKLPLEVKRKLEEWNVQRKFGKSVCFVVLLHGKYSYERRSRSWTVPPVKILQLAKTGVPHSYQQQQMLSSHPCVRSLPGRLTFRHASSVRAHTVMMHVRSPSRTEGNS